MVKVAGVEPVRVLHLLNVLDVGGMEAGVIRLVNSGVGGRVQGSICSFRPAEEFKRRLRREVPLFEFTRRDGNDPRLVLQLARLFRRERPHIIHTHSWGTLCEGVIAARLARIPRVVHGEHGTMEVRRRNLFVQRMVWRRVDRVLSVSDRLADKMAREVQFPRHRIQTIRNGVDFDYFGAGDRVASRAALQVRDDEVLVLAVGRLVPVKNHSLLLAAIAHARSVGVPCRLVVAGEGPLRGELEARARDLGIDATAALLGTRNDLPNLLAACDIFALSSRSEGMSNTILEAMAAARPVIATNVGGNPELVIHNRTGLLVAPDGPAEMAESIRALAVDRPRRDQMGLEGRRRVQLEFNLPQMLRAYEQMYLEVAAGRSLMTASTHSMCARADVSR